MISIKPLLEKLDRASLAKVSGGKNVLYYIGNVKEECRESLVIILHDNDVYLLTKSAYDYYSECDIGPFLIVRYIKPSSNCQFDNQKDLKHVIELYYKNNISQIEITD